MSKHWLPILIAVVGVLVITATALRIPIPELLTVWIQRARRGFQ